MKAVVLLSGGVDSSTCLARAVDEYGSDEVIALTAFYGQRHDKEIESARNVAKYYGVKHLEKDLSILFKGLENPLIKDSDIAIPEESYAEQLEKQNGKPVATYIPFRNGLFLSAATVVAMINGCESVFYGAHADDAAGNAYPDCSEIFNTFIRSAIYEGSGKTIRVHAPFIKMNKSQVVLEGLLLDVPYELTWSCYEGGDKPCGKCGTCIDRQKAFADNGVNDPLI